MNVGPFDPRNRGFGLILLATGGPVFAFLQLGGYAFAPLTHGAVIAPSTVTILSTILAAIVLLQTAGLILVTVGLVIAVALPGLSNRRVGTLAE